MVKTSFLGLGDTSKKNFLSYIYNYYLFYLYFPLNYPYYPLNKNKSSISIDMTGFIKGEGFNRNYPLTIPYASPKYST